jgi:hypothetical protein
MRKEIKDPPLTEKDKKRIGEAVKKAVREYGWVLRKLGENKEGQGNHICIEDLGKQ